MRAARIRGLWDRRLPRGMTAARGFVTRNEDHTMKTLDLDTLAQVTGGVSSSSAALQQSLTSIQSSISSLANNNNNNSSSNLLLPIALMAMQRRNQSVVSTPGGTIVA